MNLSAPLNGSDQLMRTFDYELRRHGFAGNQCQIILELDRRLAYDVLRDRLAALQSEYPIINARVGKIFRPKWKIMRGVKGIIPVLVHLDAPGLRQQLFNAKLWPRRGVQMRFDLVEKIGERTDVVFTWSHLLMDATAAEHFLTAVSDEKIVLPKANPQPVGARHEEDQDARAGAQARP